MMKSAWQNASFKLNCILLTFYDLCFEGRVDIHGTYRITLLNM